MHITLLTEKHVTCTCHVNIAKDTQQATVQAACHMDVGMRIAARSNKQGEHQCNATCHMDTLLL